MQEARATIAVVALVIAAGMAAAPAHASKPYMGGMLGVVSPDSARKLDNGFGFQLFAGTGLTANTTAEMSLFRHSNDFEVGGNDVDSYGLGLDLNLLLGGNAVQPFVLAGFGAQRSKAFSREDDTPFVDAGVGLMMPRLGRGASSLRAEVRGYYHFGVDSIPGEDAALDLRLNLGFAFGEGPKPAPKPVAAPAPAPAPTPPPAPVAPPRDSDRDGVEDRSDRCPGTAPATAVDDNGCAIIEQVVLKGVNFGSGSATLKPAAYETLRTVSSAMKANPDIEVEVGGYADSVGDDAKNQVLSERRAKAVVAFLIKEGVEARRLTAKGYGEADPVDSNDTPEGRANNRRVEFKVTND